jgi:hypothetical protein
LGRAVPERPGHSTCHGDSNGQKEQWTWPYDYGVIVIPWKYYERNINDIWWTMLSLYIYIHVYHASIFLWITYTVRVSPDMIFQIKSKVWSF